MLNRRNPSGLESISAGMLEALPINVMLCDIADFRIVYMNKASRETLKRIEHALPVTADQVLGSSIDVFHKSPDHQRRMLRDPSSLPHTARIKVGDEILDLLLTAVRDGRGNFVNAMVNWDVVTEKVKLEERTARLMQMIDEMPINVMTCDINDDFKIDYLNKTSLNTLRGLQSHLPIPADQILGKSFDVFHKNLSHQRAMLSDTSRLPHIANIKLGPETLRLQVSAIKDSAGNYVAPMLNWSVVTANVTMAANVSGLVHQVLGSAADLESTSQSLASSAQQATSQAMTVSSASEELTASVGEIARQVADAATRTGAAVEEARKTNALVTSLADGASRIGAVVKLISDIASQTNLLALNATIEAARAGDAGKGFAVVAGEVKNLANQTAKATDEISGQVAAIQTATRDAVLAIGRIVTSINDISGITTAISSAVEQQSAATQDVARNISGVTSASDQTQKDGRRVLDAAGALSTQANNLEKEISLFMKNSGSA